MVDAVTLLFGIGIGLVLAAALRGLWGLSGLFGRGGESDAPFAWDPARSEEVRPKRPDRPRDLEVLDELERSEPARLTVEIRPPDEEPVEPLPMPRPGAARRVVDPELLGISARIVLHLARLGRIGPEEVAPPGATQAGIVRALGVDQDSLTKVLGRLVGGGALSESLGHVQGVPRRLKVYRLTALGEELARDLRRSTGPGGASAGTEVAELR